MIIDISSYNGKIDFEKMANTENVERVVLRGTTKNGELDTRFIENLNGVIKYLPTDTIIDVYKFNYAKTYDGAVVECTQLIKELKRHGAFQFINKIWLDVEQIQGVSHTSDELARIICAYEQICAHFGAKFGVYCNYSYLKNLMPKWAQDVPIWLARWGGRMGDPSPFHVEMWQYTSTGVVNGITGAVDLSKGVQK